MEVPEHETPTYADIGITQRDAHNWQRIAEIPEEQFEEELTQVQELCKELTTAHMVRN